MEPNAERQESVRRMNDLIRATFRDHNKRIEERQQRLRKGRREVARKIREFLVGKLDNVW
jgi:hypothetical protein